MSASKWEFSKPSFLVENQDEIRKLQSENNHLKSVILPLLHLKHVLLFWKHKFMNVATVKGDSSSVIQNDIDLCLKNYYEEIVSTELLEFVLKQERLYGSHLEYRDYHSIRESGPKIFNANVVEEECRFVEETTGDKSANGEVEKQIEVKSSDSTHPCLLDHCDQVFTASIDLKRHHSESHFVDNFCKACQKQFNSGPLTKAHIQRNHQRGVYPCPVEGCDFQGLFRKDTENHHNIVHNHTVSYSCLYEGCEAILTSQSSLNNHIKTIHLKLKKHKCFWPGCEKEFFSAAQLKLHTRIHANLKPYRCRWPDCSHANSKRFNLLSHIRLCHLKVPASRKQQRELDISDELFEMAAKFVETLPEVALCDSLLLPGENSNSLNTDLNNESNQNLEANPMSNSLPVPEENSNSVNANLNNESNQNLEANPMIKTEDFVIELPIELSPELLNDSEIVNTTQESIISTQDTNGDSTKTVKESNEPDSNGEEQTISTRVKKSRQSKSTKRKESHQNDCSKFPCPYKGCGSVLTTQSSLKNHIKAIHLKLKSHKCTWPGCDRGFYTNAHLVLHTRIHANLKRFLCKWPGCTHANAKRCNLLSHIRLSHLKVPSSRKQQRELNIPDELYDKAVEYVETLPQDVEL